MSVRVRRRLAALACALVLLPIGAVQPVLAVNTIYVTTNLDGPATSDAECTLREAIVSAETNSPAYGCNGGLPGSDTIVFLNPGWTISLDSVAQSFPQISSPIVIDGGGTLTLDVDDNGGSRSVFDVTTGHLTVRGFTVMDAADTVFRVDPTGTIVLENVTCFDCKGDAAVSVQQGTVSIDDSQFIESLTGGNGSSIYNNGGTVTITDTLFQDSDAHGAAGSGGAIYNAIYDGTTPGTLSIFRSTFTGNDAWGNGGAIYNAGSLTISNSSFTGNTADLKGGAVYSSSGSVTIASTTFTTNQADGDGGAVYLADGGSVVDSVFKGNDGDAGAGLWNGGSLMVDKTTFEDNDSAPGSDGGAIFAETGALSEVRGSTFSLGNAANGGAIRNKGAMTVANSTFFANTASTSGGAIHSSTALGVLITHTTLRANTAVNGGGIYALTSAPLITNTIAVANTATSGADIGGLTPSGSSIGNVTGMPANLNTYLATSLAANGGPTKTLRVTNVAGSPFVGTANAAACATPSIAGIDQRGVTRSGACEIGAYELDRTVPVVTSSPKPSLRTNISLSGTSLRATVKWTASDTGSGVKRYILQRQTNGGSWSNVSTSVTTTSYNISLAPSKTYRFRVKAVDFDGNTTAWKTGPTVSTRLVQQTSSVTYGGSWATTSSTRYSGGSVRRASTSGAWARLAFTGRSVSFVTTKGDRGIAKIYIDGALSATVDLEAASTTYRVQAFAKTWTSSGSHTIRVVVTDPAGTNRIDIDAFAIIR